MLALVTGDWHIGVTQYGVVQEDGRNSRIADLEDVIHRMIDFAAEKEVKLFVVAGDIFHRNRPTIEEQLVFYRILTHMSNSSIPFFRFITGNHDHNSKLHSAHALKLFQEIYYSDKIVIHDETAHEFFDDFLVFYYPYQCETPDWNLIVEKKPKKTAVICHSHLEGAVVGAEPFEIKADSATKFQELPVDIVWAGHFHKPQVLSQRKPVAFYPGSPVAVDFNERLDEKGAVLYETDDDSFEWIQFGARKLYQIELSDTLTVPNEHKDQVKDAIVKVVLTMKESDFKTFDESDIRILLTSWGAHSVGINVNIIRDQAKRDEEITLDRNLVDNFKRFVSQKDYGPYQDKVIEYGEEIIKKVE